MKPKFFDYKTNKVLITKNKKYEMKKKGHTSNNALIINIILQFMCVEVNIYSCIKVTHTAASIQRRQIFLA